MSCLTKLSREQLRCDIREMPLRYRLEMLADWTGAGLAQGTPDTLGWYASRGKNHPLGPETRAWIEQRLGYLAPPVHSVVLDCRRAFPCPVSHGAAGVLSRFLVLRWHAPP
jgi:hypothetical protein